MPRLALDISIRGNALALVWQRYDFDRKFVAQIVGALGQRVVLGQYGAASPHHAGRARVESIAAPAGSEGDVDLMAVLTDIELFEQPLPTDIERPGNDVPYIWLVDDEVERVDRATALQDKAVPLELMEASGVPLETLMAVNNQVLQRYDYRCALTGERFAPVTGLHPDLHVAAIRPLSEGGRLHIDNCLPLSEAANDAFLRGHVLVDNDLCVWPNNALIDPDLLGRLHPLGRLVSPEGIRPSLENLAYHRERSLGRHRGFGRREDPSR